MGVSSAPDEHRTFVVSTSLVSTHWPAGEAPRKCHPCLGGELLDLEGAVLQVWEKNVEQRLDARVIGEGTGPLGTWPGTGLHHQQASILAL